jgi:hypothetical protein
LINREFTAAGVEPSSIGSLLLQLAEVSRKTSTPIKEVPGKLDQTIEEQKTISDHIQQMKKQTEETQREMQKILDEKGVVMENILKYLQIESELKPLGLKLTDLPQVINLVKNIISLGHDPIKIAETYASIDSVANKIKDLSIQVEDKEIRIKDLDREQQILRKSVEDLKAVKKSLDEIISLGFNEHLIGQLLDKLKQIAKDRSIPINMAAPQFVAHIIGQYDNLMGFEKMLKFQEERIHESERKVKDIQDNYEQIQTAYAEFKDAINSLILLRSKNIQDKDIIYWQTVFRDHPSLQPQMLTDSLREYGEMQAALAALRATDQAMKSQTQACAIEKEASVKEKLRLGQEIETLRKTQSEERNSYQVEMEKIRKDHQEYLRQVSKDVIEEASQKAFRAALDLKAKSSPLLPILKFENSGPLPKQEEIVRAVAHMIRMLLLHSTPPTGPLRTELEQIVEFIDKVKGGAGSGITSTSTITKDEDKEKSETELKASAMSDETKYTKEEDPQTVKTDATAKEEESVSSYTGIFRDI